MTPYYQRSGITIFCGDNREVLPTLAPESISAVITDPPAGISFMGKEWDGIKGGRDQWVAWLASVLAECERAMKPGAHALVWALPRTSGWTHRAIEDAGMDVRDCVTHLFGSGFPKSANVSKLIDKAAGAERGIVGYDEGYARRNPNGKWGTGLSHNDNQQVRASVSPITAPATPEAAQWDGWGTALKPGAEFWYLARKPFASTVAANVLRHGCGAINVDACRIGYETVNGGNLADNPHLRTHINGGNGGHIIAHEEGRRVGVSHAAGRWPSNVILDADAAALLDAMSGERKSPGNYQRGAAVGNAIYGKGMGNRAEGDIQLGYGDSGGPSRFFTVVEQDAPTRMKYVAKASRRERNAGLEGMPERDVAHRYGLIAGGSTPQQTPHKHTPAANSHPTVKPLALMEWLIRLVTPPNGLVLDPFAGSGTTGVACARLGIPCVLIEMSEEYCEIIARRIDHALDERERTVTQQALMVAD